MATDEQIERLAASVSRIVGALLVAGRQGQPAEGRLPFNPLHFHLLRLVAARGPLRPSVLADGLGVVRTTISAASRSLEGRGLLERRPDPTDGRAHVLALTSAGREVVSAIERQDRRNAAAMMDGMSAERTALLVDLIEEVGAKLAGQEEALAYDGR